MVALIALLTLSGCLSSSRIQGAKTLEKGQYEFGLATGLRSPDDPFFPLPFPTGPFTFRLGVGDNVDIGLRGYLLGSGLDVRWRFWTDGKWHLAVNPGASALVNLSLLNPTQFGAMEASMPLVGEVDLNRWLTASGGVHLTLRDKINYVDVGGGGGNVIWLFNAHTGAGARLEAHPGLFVLGLYLDGYWTPTLHTHAPGFAGGIDMKIRTRSKAEAAERRERRGL